MGGIVMAWLVGEGIVTWRWFKAGAPPPPGSLVAVSGFFALLAVLATYQPARAAATAVAFGIDIAAFLQFLPGTVAPGKTGWPPPLIVDPTAVLPPSAASKAVGGFAAGVVAGATGGASLNTKSPVGGAAAGAGFAATGGAG